MFQIACEFVSGIHAKDSLRPNQLIRRNIDSTKACGDRCDSVLRKPHNGTRHLVHLAKPLFAILGREGNHFDRLCLKQIARRVDTVDTYIVERPSAEILPESDVILLDLHRKN